MVRGAPSNQEINEKSKGHQVARRVMNGLRAPNDQESADCRALRGVGGARGQDGAECAEMRRVAKKPSSQEGS